MDHTACLAIIERLHSHYTLMGQPIACSALDEATDKILTEVYAEQCANARGLQRPADYNWTTGEIKNDGTA